MEWQKIEYREEMKGKKVYVSHGGDCVCIDSSSNTVEQPANLQGVHMEADTLVAFHVAHCKGDVVVRGTDTDLLIILLGMLGKHKEEQTPSSRIWTGWV